LDVFNLFNRQAITRSYERYNRIENGYCAGIPPDICNGDGGIATKPGTLIPVGVLSDPAASAPNPDFLTKGSSFTGQRSIRVGFRVTF